MNMQKDLSKWVVATVVSFCFLGFASQASAISLTEASPEFMGSIIPSVPSDPEDEVDYINALKDLAPGGSTTVGKNDIDRSANVLCYSNCPDASPFGSVKDESGSNTGNFGSGFTYLLVKYGGGALVWYVAGLTGDFDVPATFDGKGVSHWSLYGVPEPNSILLVGFALVAVGIAGRRWLTM